LLHSKSPRAVVWSKVRHAQVAGAGRAEACRGFTARAGTEPRRSDEGTGLTVCRSRSFSTPQLYTASPGERRSRLELGRVLPHVARTNLSSVVHVRDCARGAGL